MTDRTARVERVINAPREAVYDAWLDPEGMKAWITFDAEHGAVTLDPRVGGQYEILMAHGGKTYPHRGEFTALDRPEKIEMTWRSDNTGWKDSLVTVLFEEAGPGATRVILTHRAAVDPASHESGWAEILDALAGRLETVPA